MWITRSFKETDFWAQIKGSSKPTQETATKSTLNHPKEDKRTDARAYPRKQSSKWTRLAAVRRRHNLKVGLYHVSRNIWSLRAALSQIYTCVSNALSQNIKCLVNFPWKERGKSSQSHGKDQLCSRHATHLQNPSKNTRRKNAERTLSPQLYWEIINT